MKHFEKKMGPTLFSYRGKLRFVYFSCLLTLALLFIALLWLQPGPLLLLLFLAGVILSCFYFSSSLRTPFSALKVALKEGTFSMRLPIPPDERAASAIAYNKLAGHIEEFESESRRIQEQMEAAQVGFKQTLRLLEDHSDNTMLAIKPFASRLRGLQSGVQNLGDELNRSSQSASATELPAVTGEEGLREMETIMQKMFQASSNIVTTLLTLQDEVGTINQVIVAIIKIADQSNLLSLNTAIRANKSGAQGKGFTVIAASIREMADQIALATLDIEQSVQEIIKTVLEASEHVNAFSEKVHSQDQETLQISQELTQLIQHTQSQLEQFERIKEEIAKQLQEIGQATPLIQQMCGDPSILHSLSVKLLLHSGRHLGGIF